MTEYIIYYLPNAVRDKYPGMVGKIGITTKERERARYDCNKSFRYDMTGYCIIETVYANTLTDAKTIELFWQEKYGLVDGPKSKEARARNSARNTGIARPKSPEMIQAISAGYQEWTCEYCNVSGRNNGTYVRWHGDRCKQNPNRLLAK